MTRGLTLGPEHRPVIVGFEGLEPDWSWLAEIRPAGVILFTRNLADFNQVQRVCQRIRAMRPQPFIAIDLEGGRVNRLAELVGPLPSISEAVARGRTREAGQVIGTLLASLGMDVDFAPVVDLDYGQLGNGLQGRTMGAHVEAVVSHAREFVAGLNQAGVAGCFKHFPGLGTTVPDSHLELPVYLRDEDHWHLHEGAVYRRLAEEGLNEVPIMLAHCTVPFWRGSVASWAAQSAVHLDAIGWTGATMTDDLEMKAIDPERIPETALKALQVGIDLVMICRQRTVVDAVVNQLDRAGVTGCRRTVTIPYASQNPVALDGAVQQWRAFSASFQSQNLS